MDTWLAAAGAGGALTAGVCAMTAPENAIRRAAAMRFMACTDGFLG
jgi:hypothetical protein